MVAKFPDKVKPVYPLLSGNKTKSLQEVAKEGMRIVEETNRVAQETSNRINKGKK